MFFLPGLSLFMIFWTSLAAPIPQRPESVVQVRDYNPSGSYTGKATWYNVSSSTGAEGADGACGWPNVDSDLIVAVSKDVFDTWPGATANPNNNPICNKKITITVVGQSDSTVQVTVADRCPGCEDDSLDLSPGAFQKLADLGKGVLDINWTMD